MLGDPGLRFIRETRSQKAAISPWVAKPRRSRAAAGPVDEFLVADVAVLVMRRDHPLSQVIDLLEILAPRDRKLSRAPEHFERGLGGMPVPPAAGFVLDFLQIAGQHRATLGDPCIGVVAALLKTFAAPFLPALDDRLAFPFEAMLPVAEETARNDRSVVRPMFEQIAIVFQQRRQMLPTIGLVAGKQDLMMGAFDGGDAVHLHKADAVDELQQALLAERTVRRAGKALLGEEDATGVAVGKANRHGNKNRLLFP